jgi:hypothetical protein
MIAALFVQSGGPYYGLPDVVPYDEIGQQFLTVMHQPRPNALTYAGPWPVVAHPPCQLWGRFAIINFKRWGGEHNRPGNDGGCFRFALDAVYRYGGVLEHPAGSYAFKAHGIPPPRSKGWTNIDTRGAWVCEVWQSAYGHKANKKTWLLYYGKTKPFDLNWSRPKGTHQIGFFDQRGKDRNKPTISGKEASATPIEFRNTLLRLARMSRPNTPDQRTAAPTDLDGNPPQHP